MKLVSRRWQEIKEDKAATERFEYLSLRDREAYSELKKFWDHQNQSEVPKSQRKSRKLSEEQAAGAENTTNQNDNNLQPVLGLSK